MADRIVADADAGENVEASGATPLGLRALAEAATVPNQRVPTLESALTRLAVLLKPALRVLASDDADVSLVSTRTTRYAGFLAGLSGSTLVTVVRADPWAGQLLVGVDAGLVLGLVELLMGGRTGSARAGAGPRPFTAIERHIAGRLVEAVLQGAETAFAAIGNVSFAPERVETNPLYLAIAPQSGLVVTARYRVEIGDVSGEFDLVIPHATLEPVRAALAADEPGDRLGHDEIWRAHLAAQAAASEIAVAAILFEGRMPLGRIMNLGIGDTLMFGARPEDVVALRCEDVVLAHGRLGRVDGSIAVKVEAMQGMSL